MGNYPRIENLLEKFVFDYKDNLSALECKWINIIINHIDDIVPLGTAAGRRIEELKKLLEFEKDSILTKEKVCSKESCDLYNQGLILSKLEVENFRGISHQIDLDLSKQYTLIYGGNGTGKSSCCEALEFGLLGTIAEAENKRITLPQYIRNTMDLGEPSLRIFGKERGTDKIIPIAVSQESYQYCFVEKNRIDNFSRLSSKIPSEQNELLAALFGIDAFNNFVNNFTDNPEERLKYNPQHIEKLKTLKEKLKEDIGNKNSYLEDLAKIDEEKHKLVQDSGYKTIAELKNSIIEHKQSIQNQLIALKKESLADLRIDELQKSVKDIGSVLEKYKEKEQDYNSKKESLQLRKLYDIVLEMEQKYPDRCPVCQTPIFGDRMCLVHPYHNAKNKLEELREITLLEEEYSKCQENLMKNGSLLITELKKWEENAKCVNIDIGIDIPNDLLMPTLNERKNLSTNYNKFLTLINEVYWNKYLEVFEKVKMNNAEANDFQFQIKTLNQENSKLEGELKQIESIELRYKLTNSKLREIDERVNNFDKQNADLIKKADEDQRLIEEREKYIEAYKLLINKLKRYRDGLFHNLVKNLNVLTTEFYNCINRGDSRYELIDHLELPTASNSEIKVAFKDNPDKEVNALYILSEGHIRCLGVAILLAKAVSEQVQFIIFDDIINAIDTDHRNGIRHLLFNDKRLYIRQYILSSHSGEFIKDVENLLKANDRSQLMKRINLQNLDCRGVCFSEWSMHYLVLAGEKIQKDNLREALVYCRQGLENITYNLWNTLQKKNVISGINVFLRKPTDKPELKKKIIELRKAVEKRIEKNECLEYQNCLNYLKTLEGTQTTCCNEWKYLNGGVHEEMDIPDFERESVKAIYEILLELEKVAKPKRIN